MSESTLSKVKIPQVVAERIAQLEQDLKDRFGCDYSFTICGRGEIIAASTMKHGKIVPRIE